MIKKSNKILLIGLICSLFLLSSFSFSASNDAEWKQLDSFSLFTVSFDGSQKDFSIDELKSFPSITGLGGRLKETGDVIGPYEYTGVSIEVLASQFPSLPNQYEIVSISEDGYLFKYTFDTIQGNVQIYDCEGNSQGIGNVHMILAYEEDGEPLVHGGPFRIVFVNEDSAITDAFLWSKYVEEIEFVFDSTDLTPPDIAINKPADAIYYNDKELVSYPQPFVIGDITIKVGVSDENSVAKVLFVLNNDIKSKQQDQPYQWNFDKKGFGQYTIRIMSYDDSGNIGSTQKTFLMLNFF
jgi:hypothetical protein